MFNACDVTKIFDMSVQTSCFSTK